MQELALLVILVGVYVAPWFIAMMRDHRNTGAILALNLLLGWTVLGWIAALVWALTDPGVRSRAPGA